MSWYIDFISSTVNVKTSLIDDPATVGLSLNIISSPAINLPVVCDKQSSFIPVAPPFLARYPIAPLAKPLTFSPSTTVILISVHFNIVNVWISYKCKSQGVVAPTYEASESPKEYTLASPTCSPCANILLVPTLWFLNWTTLVLFPPRLTVGAPRTLFTLIRLPILNGIDAFFIVFVVLGFSTSMTVVPGKDTS